MGRSRLAAEPEDAPTRGGGRPATPDPPGAICFARGGGSQRKPVLRRRPYETGGHFQGAPARVTPEEERAPAHPDVGLRVCMSEKPRKKYDLNSPEARALIDEIVHGTFMKEGTMTAFSMCFPGAS